jgi:hypothetical protein
MKKNKRTLEEKLANRKFHSPNRFFYSIYHLLSRVIILHKYHPTITIKDDINKCKGPCILIWNHLSRIDHAYVTEATYPKRLNIVAGYNEFFRSHLHLPFRMVNVIPKKNFATDLAGTKAMMSIIKQGGSFAMAPEGMSSIYGTNQPIVVGTGHMLKHLGVPVYFLHLKGEYLANTKVCLDERIGKCEAELSLLFSPADLQKLSKEEIEDKINLAFKGDDYEYARQIHVKWKTYGRICDHLDDLCYRCPKCGQELKMEANGDTIRCSSCGNGAKMNDYYEFEPFNKDCVIPVSPSAWVKEERKVIMKEIRDNSSYAYSLKCEIGFLPKYHYLKHHQTSNIEGSGTFTIDHKGLHFVGTRNNEPYSFDVDYHDIFTLTIVTDMTRFAFYVGPDYVELVPPKGTTGKVLLLVEEMHRLHANIWKRFPWDEELIEVTK